MATEIRKSGISVVGDVPWGTHFCHFYETKEDLLDTLVPYFKAGLESKEFCMWVVSNSDLITVEEAKGALAQAVPDLDQHLAAGNIEILNGLDWYLDKNVFNLEKVASAWDARLKRALARGYDGLRVSGDTFWLRKKDWKDFCAYEKQLNDSMTDRPMTVLCTYPLAKSGAAEILDVAQTHQFAIARRQGEWEVIESLELIQAKAEIKRLNEALQSVIQRTPKPSAILGYGVAVLSVAAALIIARSMETALGSVSHVSLFLCAVMFSAWFGGVRSGLLAVGLSLIAFDYYFLPPNYSLAVKVKEIPRLLIFALSALFVGSLSAAQRSAAESLRRARDVLEGTVQDLKRANESLQAENAERRRAEEALRGSEERFRQMAENISEVFWLSTADLSNRLYTSPAYEAVWGRTCESLYRYPRSFIDAIHAEDRARVIDLIERDRERGFEVQYRVVRPDGSIRWIRDRGFPITDVSGHFYRVAGIAEDFTERKQAEDSLRRSEDHLRRVIDTIPTMAWSIRLDGAVDFVNQRWMDYTGLSLEEESEEPMLPVHHEDVPRAMERWLVEKEIGEPYEDEMRLRRADGEYRWFLVRTAPLRDEQGNLIKWYGVSIDIEDRKRAGAALKESQRRLEEAQRIAHVGHWDRDLETGRITWSDEIYRILGLPLQECDRPRTELLDVVHPEDRQRVSAAIEEAERDIRPLDVEFRVVRPNGEVRFLHSQGDVIRDERGRPLRMFGTSQDITERRSADHELKKEKEILEKIFDNIPVMIGFVGEDGRVKLVNAEWERTIGWTLKELGEQNVDIFTEAYPDPSYRQQVLDFVTASTGEWVDLKIKVRDGRVIDAACAAVHLSDGTKVVIAQDISERKSAEERISATSEQLRALSARLQSAKEEESIRIARELHDELGAALSSLRWDLEEVGEVMSDSMDLSQFGDLTKRIEAMIELTDTTVNVVRRVASELRPMALDELGLSEAIEWQARQFKERTGIIVHCDCDQESFDLSGEQSTAVFRIFQEALTNILRHARSTKVNIRMQQEDDEFILTISDNGRGITDDEKLGQRTLGLLGMRERAHLIGGKVDITGSDGKGAVVTVRIPSAKKLLGKRH